MWIVVQDQQVLCPPLRARPLIGRDEASNVIVLQQRQAVDGALVDEVLPIGCGEHLHGDGALVQRAAVHGAVPAASDQLEGSRKDIHETSTVKHAAGELQREGGNQLNHQHRTGLNSSNGSTSVTQSEANSCLEPTCSLQNAYFCYISTFWHLSGASKPHTHTEWKTMKMFCL